MLLSTNSRYFIRHEVGLRPQRDKGAPLAFLSADELDVVDVLRDAMKAGTSNVVISENDVVKLTLLDVREKDGMAIFLFRRSDPDASAPVFEDRKKNTLRLVDKAADEAEAVSAHLFLSLDAAQKPHPVHRAILEEVPGLGRTYVQAVIREALRQRRYEYEDDKGNTHETYTLAEFGGVASETVGNAVKGGEIKFIELVREPRLDGLDTGGLIPHEERMRLSVKPSDRRNLPLVGRIQEWARGHDWTKVKVQVQSGSRTKLVDVAREADAADVLFVKSEQVHTKGQLRQCTDVINEELAEIAKKMLASDANW